MVEWKGRHNVTRDSCSKYVGGAERTGWVTLLEIETMDLQESQNSIGATTLVVDLARAFEGPTSCGVEMGHVFCLPAESAEGALRILTS